MLNTTLKTLTLCLSKYLISSSIKAMVNIILLKNKTNDYSILWFFPNFYIHIENSLYLFNEIISENPVKKRKIIHILKNKKI